MTQQTEGWSADPARWPLGSAPHCGTIIQMPQLLGKPVQAALGSEWATSLSPCSVPGGVSAIHCHFCCRGQCEAWRFTLCPGLKDGGQVPTGAALPSALSFLILLLVHHVGENYGEAPMLRGWGHTCFSQTCHFLGNSLNLHVAVGL